MILRGAVIASESRTLPVPRPPVAPSVGARLAAKEPDVSTATEPVSGELTRAVLVHPPAPVVQKEELTFEAVTAWLAVQDSDTRQDCASLLADELTLVYEKSRAEGLAAGKEAGTKAAQEELQAQLTVLRSVADEAETQFASESVALASACADIVAEAFVKIGGSVLCTKEAALGAVEQVLKRVKEAREVTIRVNAFDVKTLTTSEDNLAAALAGRKFSIVPDSRVELGGCIIESKLGSLDGRFEAQLRELFELLRAAKATGVERP